MRAAVIRQFHEPLVIEERPIPEPGQGEIRVKIETSGVCHTDIHAANGDWPVKPALPLVPGHEGVGLVDALGEGVTRVDIGQRVAIPWLGGADGTCEYCVKGLETYCLNPTFTGYTVDGGYREFSIANANYVGIVPEGLDPLDAAPLTCAGVTTYKAVKTAEVGPSDVVGIVGIGGLGHLGLQYARIAGGYTVAIDVDDAKLDLAKRLGVDQVIHAGRQDVVTEMRALGGLPRVTGQPLGAHAEVAEVLEERRKDAEYVRRGCDGPREHERGIERGDVHVEDGPRDALLADRGVAAPDRRDRPGQRHRVAAGEVLPKHERVDLGRGTPQRARLIVEGHGLGLGEIGRRQDGRDAEGLDGVVRGVGHEPLRRLPELLRDA